MAPKTIIAKDAPPDVIERDIARTRAEMSETIDRIEEKFSAGHWREVTKETIREKVDSATARGKELAGRARESAQRFRVAAGERAVEAKDRLLQFIKDDPAAANLIAFEAGAWLVIILKTIGSKRRLRASEEQGGRDYARAKILSMEEVEQKVESAALAPEEEEFGKAA